MGHHLRTSVFSLSLLVASLGTNASFAEGLSVFSGQTLTGRFVAEIAGLSVAELDFSLDVKDSTYNLSTSARSRGILSLFIKFQSDVTAQGVFDDQGLRPVTYTLDGYSRGSDRSSTLEYGPDGSLLTIQTNPSPAEENREPVPPMAVVNTLDPAAVFMKLLHQSLLGKGQSCIFDRRIYDGYRLSHVYLQPIDQAGVEISKAGLAEVSDYYDVDAAHPCYVNGRLLFGRKLDEEERERDDSPAFIWFAPSKAIGKTVPAVFSRRTRFGTAIIRVFDLKIDGQVIQSAADTTSD